MKKEYSGLIGFDHSYLAKLESGKEPLPVGVYKSSNGYGYRISKSFRGRDFHFGTFQDLGHVLRTNEYLNRFISAVNEELEERPTTAEEVNQIIVENRKLLTTCIKMQNENNKERFDDLDRRFKGKQSLWKRIKRIYW